MSIDPALLAQLDLRDIHEPGLPGWWPPAPGWWILVAAALLAMFWIGRWLGRIWRRRRLRQRVLSELNALPNATDCEQLISGVSTLLKRVALRRFPRQQVAALTGTNWLAFLDQTGGDGQFANGAGRVLEQGPYAPAPSCDAPALRALAERWLIRNL